MATDIKGQTIASTYQDLVKRDSGTYSQTGMNIEIQNDSGTALATGLYLESGATTDNVGIGVAAPTASLHILDTGSLASALTLENTSGGQGSMMYFNNNSASPANDDILGGVIFLGDDGGGNSTGFSKIFGRSDTYAEGNEDGSIAFECAINNASTEIMRINATGVGIGTTAPTTELDILVGSSYTSSNPILQLSADVADEGDQTMLALNSKPGSANGAGLLFKCRRHSSGSSHVYSTIQSTSNSGSVYGGTKNLALNPGGGNVGIGTTAPTTKLDVTGTNHSTAVRFRNAESQLDASDKILQLAFYNNGNTPDDDGFFIYAEDIAETKFLVYSHGEVETRIGTDITAISDERLKTNIVDYNDGLAFINSLKPRKYNWKDGLNRSVSDTQYGFIAQEIEEVSDGSMLLYRKRKLEEEASENKYINNGEIYTTQMKQKDAQYVSAIQELSTMIQELSAKVTALENA